MNYHVNAQGKVAVCNAKKKCPLEREGQPAPHYPTQASALAGTIADALVKERLALYRRGMDSNENDLQEQYVSDLLVDVDDIVIEEDKPSFAERIKHVSPHTIADAPTVLPVVKPVAKPSVSVAPVSAFDSALAAFDDDDEY